MNSSPKRSDDSASTSPKAYPTNSPGLNLLLENWIVAVANEAGALGLGVFDIGERSELDAK